MKNAQSVRGNHDEAVLREYANREKDSNHVLRDKYEWITASDKSERDFLTNLPYTITVPSRNILIVHAGLVPGKQLLQQKTQDMVTMRNAFFTDYFDGNGWQGTSSGDVGYPWASLWTGPHHVYFGHDAKRKLQLYDYATGLDTGCVYGGCLTAAVLDPNVNVPVEFVTVNAQAIYRQK
uniref:Uncharacterized protein LOC100371593 n=1 Tax=Saccoglossus kowalevskii TaxID=10224 RepID=A0ABM0MWE9_SACKO|nr:PREDICTED: uncharacterized protein LOC100371593 [Saccoglossus kowalevskii]